VKTDFTNRWVRYPPLLAALAVAMLVVGPLAEAGYGSLASSISIPVILLSSAFIIRHAGRLAWVAVGIWVAMGLFELVVPMQVHPRLAIAIRFGDAAFVALVASVLMRNVIQSERVTIDTILGGVSVYLFVGVFFTTVYSALELAAPGSFLDGGQPLKHVSALEGAGQFPALAYYSLVTMTTLGYGVVTPESATARSLASAQAVIGQLYVAVLIAFLVGLHIVQRGAREDGA
jgi:hypothetical protein